MGRRTISIIKFLIFISIIILSLGITISYAINQQSTFDDARVVLRGNRHETVDNKEMIYITVQNLDYINSILCSGHNMALAKDPDSYNLNDPNDVKASDTLKTVVSSWRGHKATKVTDQGNGTGYLTHLPLSEIREQTIFRDENGEHADEVTWTDWTENEPDIPSDEPKVYTRTVGLYEIKETHIATPKEAYILSYLNGGNGVNAKAAYNGHANAPQQTAWWHTGAGSRGYSPPAAGWLYEEATNFENYVVELLRKNNQSLNSVSYNDDNTIKMDYPVSMDSSNVKVLFDSTSNTYKIGPMTVDYVRAVSTVENRTIKFAGIKGASLIGLKNDGTEFTIPESDYKFVYTEGNLPYDGYPEPNEEFFIELNYVEDVTAIKSFKFDFEYTNAGATYQYLEGTYYNLEWAEMVDAKYKVEYESVGNTNVSVNTENNTQVMPLSNTSNYSIEKLAGVDDPNTPLIDESQMDEPTITWNTRPVNLNPNISAVAENGTITVNLNENILVGIPSWNGYSDGTIENIFYNGNHISNDVVQVSPNCNVEVSNIKFGLGQFNCDIKLTNTTPDTEYTITIRKNSMYQDANGVKNGDNNYTFDRYTNNEFSFKVKSEPEELEKVEDPSEVTPQTGNNNQILIPHYYYKYKYYLGLNENGVSDGIAQILINCPGGKIEEVNTHLVNTNGHEEEKNIEVEFVTEPWDLTTSISGMVWKDRTEDKKTGGFGTYQTEEDLLDKIEVKIYKVYYDSSGQEKDRELAKAYKTKSTENDKVSLNDLIDFNSSNKTDRLYTGMNGQEKGKYKVYLPVPGVSKDDTEHAGLFATYDVEFTYDGQNYEPTEFLMSTAKSSVGDKLTEFENTNTAGPGKDYEKYANDSYVIESESDRKTFDEKFGQVYGQSPVADNKTEGKSAKLNNTEEKTLNYNSDIDNGTSRLRSQLETLDSDGYVLDQYQLSSRTSTSGFALPFTKYYHVDEDNFDNVIIQNNTYQPVSEYFNQINLGLLERNLADIGITKDLYKASVVVNEKELITKYNQSENLTGDSLDIQIDLGKKIQNYSLGLYNSDFYYRSSVYEYKPNGEDEENSEYKTSKDIIGTIKEGTELRVFATYKISLYNESEYFDVTVNNLNDYYDKTFTLVSDDIKDEIINESGERETKVIADKTYYRITNGGKYSYNKAQDIENCTNGTIDWKQNNDSGQYHMMNTNSLVGVKIPAGEKLEIFVTYEVDKEGYEKAKTENYDEATYRENLLNSKNNIAEVTNYSTYYSKASEERHNTTSYKAGNVAGRIDRDSAPGNIVIGDKSLWEDDTAGAPVFNIQLKEGIDREINGIVWEDSQTKELQYSQKVGDGIYDHDNEDGIEGVNVTLVEKISADIDGTNIEFEYVWPDDAFGEKIPGYTSTVTTKEDGTYQLKDFVSGTYVVRFEYGNNGATIKEGYTGQDYKNTGYQMGYKNTSAENIVVGEELNVPGAETLNNVYHDLSNNKEANDLNSARVSDARDYEPRRMEVIAYSRTISNSNGEVFAISDELKKLEEESIAKYMVLMTQVQTPDFVFTDDHKYKKLGEQTRELINATSMVANTAKLNIEIENPNTIQYNSQDKDIKVVDGNNQVNNTYIISNIDFGLEKRSETKIDLKKKISKITLTKLSDSTSIMTVAINDDGTIDTEKSTSLEKLMHVPSTDDVQGFDWINIEDNYLTDLGIRIEYKIVVTNNSEVDWTGEELSKLYTPGQIVSNAKNLEGNLENAGAYVLSDSIIKYGQYLGLNYYTNEYYGEEGKTYNVGGMEYNADKIVKTTVDQVADYIDKDIGLDDEYNNNIENHAWYLADNSKIDETTGKVESLNGIISEGSYSSENASDKKQYLLDTNGVAYVTNNKSNIALSENTMISDEDENYTYNSLTIKSIGRYIDGRFSGSEITETEKPVITYKGFKSYKKSSYNPTGSNKDFIKELTPVAYNTNNSSSSIGLTTSVQVQSGTAAENMNYDNMAEIVIYSNTVGRRTPDSIPGNAIERVNKLSEERDNGSGILYAAAKLEPDTDATEYVTFTEPTGLSYALESQNIYITVLLIALIVLAVGVIVITISVVTVKTKNSKIE